MNTNWNKYSDKQIGFPDDTLIIEMAVHMTAHAADRAATRNGKPVGIDKEMIQRIIDSAEDKILQLGKKFPTLIIKTKDAINIVGSLAQQAGEWVFDVITVMVKKNFVPKTAFDKVVYVNENLKEAADLRSTVAKLRKQGYDLARHFDSFKLKKDDKHFLEFTFHGGGYDLQKLFAKYTYDDPYDALVDLAQTGKIDIRYNSLSTDFPVPDISPRLKNSYAQKGVAPQVQESIQSTLVAIIDRIEKERIGKISRLQEFQIGTRVKHRGQMGNVIEISPKKTSVLVEFSDKTQKRFFVNKRAENLTLDELSMHKMIKSIKK